MIYLTIFEILSTACSRNVAFDTLSRSLPHTAHFSGGASQGIKASLFGETVFFHPHDGQT
ncbi:MAG: hypothetical protein J0M01_05445 [Dechloromonas sp.]|jgi:hypothetical protein|nr:hypothetical protein [Dechloromonas sp.]